MDFTKYQPKKPLMPSLFSGIKPTLSLPSLKPQPAKPAMPAITPTPQTASSTPTSAPTVTAPKTQGSGTSPVTTPTTPIVPTPQGTGPNIAEIMKSLQGISTSLGNMKDTPATDPKKPAVPTLPDTSTQEKGIMELLKPTTDETKTQEEIDNLVNSTKQGYLGVENKAIPMEFITGQKSAIEKRALGLAEPLEQKLARLQAQRTASLEASKFSLERTDKRFAAENEASKTAFDQKYKTDSLDEQKRKTDLDYALSDKKFEEDKRQFGMEYALKARETAIKEKEAATKAGEATAGTLTSDKASNLQLVNDILNLGPSKITGVGQNPLNFLGITNQEQINKFNQLKSTLSLENRQKLKGSGAISDFEARTLDSAASALGRNLPNAALERELKKVRGVFQTSAGLDATVKITNPSTGEISTVAANRDGINQAIADGMMVEYQ